ncbi:MAG: hypothetical protein LBF58_09055 [Deltaproteobacteria bacterium]|jgi:hypothetical protein|nr:hypothetical protein [Deltaproteobacteria bacterium]
MRIIKKTRHDETSGKDYPVYEFISEYTVKGKPVVIHHLTLGPEFTIDESQWPTLADRIETVLSGQTLLFPPSPRLEEAARDIAAIILRHRAHGGEPPEPAYDPYLDDLRPEAGGEPAPRDGLPYGLGWLALDALRETTFTRCLGGPLRLAADGHAHALALALAAARLERPANLAGTLAWLAESSGIPALLGLTPQSGWERQAEQVLDYLFANHGAFFNPNQVVSNEDTPGEMVFLYDMSRNFLDDPEPPAGPPAGPVALMALDAAGYVSRLDMRLPENARRAPGRARLLETFIGRLKGQEPDRPAFYFIGPWDDRETTLRLMAKLDPKAQAMIVERRGLPEPGSYKPPLAGEISAAKIGRGQRTYVWGYPGYGPTAADLRLRRHEIRQKAPGLGFPKRLVAFGVTMHAGKPGQSPPVTQETIELALTAVLRANTRFRLVAPPEYPLGLAGDPGAGPHSEGHETLLGAVAYQCLTYMANLFTKLEAPFDWEALKSLLNAQRVTHDPLAPPPGLTFGDPGPRAKKILGLFDCLEKPLLWPILNPASINDLAKIGPTLTKPGPAYVMKRHAGRAFPVAKTPMATGKEFVLLGRAAAPPPGPPRPKTARLFAAAGEAEK